ncbi:hypothetical protein [Solicola sp. PLA-1-18]|uniref:hypothetical protein n=1 Tax=Solicola sp. PLA-1-18 TaxID=3380532 RepID=UPI003B82C52E
MSSHETPSGAPRAARLRRRRWSDPRVLVGLVIVAASVAGVATLVSTADDTVAVWATRSDVRAGEAADVAQLRPVRVRLDDDTRSRYVVAEGAASDRFVDALDGRVWSRSLDGGELVAEGAITDQADAADAEVPLRVERGALPDDLATGDTVDVWVTPQDGAQAGATDAPGARRVATAVRVLDVGGDGGALGDATSTTVLVAVDDAALEDVVGAVGGARVTLVRVPGA